MKTISKWKEKKKKLNCLIFPEWMTAEVRRCTGRIPLRKRNLPFWDVPYAFQLISWLIFKNWKIRASNAFGPDFVYPQQISRLLCALIFLVIVNRQIHTDTGFSQPSGKHSFPRPRANCIHARGPSLSLSLNRTMVTKLYTYQQCRIR